MARFVKGGKPGPGRPKLATKERKYADIFREALTPEAAYQIVAKAVAQAANGDHRAREWIFKHVLSPQPQKVDVGRFVTESQIEVEMDHRMRFFDMALHSCRRVEEVEFLMSVARRLAESQGEKDDGARDDRGAREGRE